MKSILSIIGARPQFVKAAVVSKALAEAGIREHVIHTGQHYDHNMSTIFWEELGLPVPQVNLGVGSGGHGAQTGLMLQKLEAHMLQQEELPDALLVYGDTNSTLAGALVAAKLHVPVVHVEAGLRSFNREMPEEINRVMTDHVSSMLFCSSREGVDQLAKEGITHGVHNVGDVMYDALLTFSEVAENKLELSEVIPFDSGDYYLATIHRPSNTDDLNKLSAIVEALGQLDKKVIWPVHPRNNEAVNSMELPDNLFTMEPVSYFEMMVLLKNAYKVITDSGGLQKEAYWMKKPCLTVRKETEWVETLEGNWNQLCGDEPRLLAEFAKNEPQSSWKPLYGEGNAAKQISQILQDFLNTQLQSLS